MPLLFELLTPSRLSQLVLPLCMRNNCYFRLFIYRINNVILHWPLLASFLTLSPDPVRILFLQIVFVSGHHMIRMKLNTTALMSVICSQSIHTLSPSLSIFSSAKQRRLRHLRSIAARNIVNKNGSPLLDTYFTLHLCIGDRISRGQCEHPSHTHLPSCRSSMWELTVGNVAWSVFYNLTSVHVNFIIPM